MAKQSKFPQLVTKPGTAKWPHLVTPDTTFNKKGVYTTKLLWEPDEFDKMELKTIIDKLVKDKYEDTIDGLKKTQADRVFTQFPYGDDVNEEKEETGKIYVQFKSNASFEKDGETVNLKPILFDAAGNQIKRRINIGNGSVLCIKTTIKPYVMESEAVIDGKKMKIKNVGVTLYIGAVQIRELIEYGADAAQMGFDTDGEALAGGDDQAFEPGDEEKPADGESDF
jgi:hypothetical protein